MSMFKNKQNFHFIFIIYLYVDSLDGLVARTRVRQRAMIADHTQWGYWMDGICDLTGTIFFMIAVLNICQRSLPRRTVTFQIPPIFYYILAPIKNYTSKITPSTSDLDTEAFLPTVRNFYMPIIVRIMSRSHFLVKPIAQFPHFFLQPLKSIFVFTKEYL